VTRRNSVNLDFMRLKAHSPANARSAVMKLPHPGLRFFAYPLTSCCRGILVLCGVVSLVSSVMGQRPLGADVSGYQPASIPWSTATNAGVKFAWSKATEGTGYTNPNFASQVAGALAARVYIGAYHYARPGLHPNLTGSNSADSEAAYFWSVAGTTIKNGGQYLMPMLDWEDVGTAGQPATAPALTNGFTASMMSAWLNEWCTSLSNTAYASGVIINPVIYSGSWYSQPGSVWPGLNSTVTNRPNNMSGYPTTPNPQTGAPSSTAPWPSWVFWQYADTNWTGGDSDVFNGTLATLINKFVIGGTNAPSISAQPTNVFVEIGSPAAFYVTASGLNPLAYQWQHNGANIAGATSNSFSIASVQAADVGSYTVVVSNSYAAVPSSIGYLTILSNAPGAIPAPSGLVDWWPADGAAADLLTSYSGSPVGNVTYVTGERGSGWHFDGATAYLVTGAPSLAVPWTACMWVKREQSSGTASAIMGDGLRELKLEQYSNTFNVGFTIFGVADYKWSYTAPQGVWTHLAYVASGNQMQLYANGSLIGTIATNCPCPRGWIGAGYVSSGSRIVDYMKGALDEVQIFNRALSGSEINSIYSAGSAGLIELPTITAGDFIAASQFRLAVQGLTSRSISIWSSPDLASWTKLATVSNPSGAITYTDSQATNDSMFYRASQP
jgi:GH25 family lysozyme M1 (1,4-beta-N-acetylmuramidase)